ncbi:MAG: manganese efflux pump MntP family protein [Clostridia bacterium]|nr:manganese efflux pump MntP family protein [Clostridia bacterium]
MSLWELWVIAAALSADAFAAAVCKGLAAGEAKMRYGVVTGLYYGTFQVLMPTIGYFAGKSFAGLIERADHWAAFAILMAIGIDMIKNAGGEIDERCSFAARDMLPSAVATSIDALAAGMTFAFLEVDIWRASLLIGITTFVFSWAGCEIGGVFGAKYKKGAETAGGIILILMGIKVVCEHLKII